MRCKKKRIKRYIILLISVIFTGISISMFFRNTVNPIIIEYAQAKVKTLTVTAVNKAVFNVMENISYNDLITVQKDNNGKIIMLSANTQTINNIAKNTARQSQSEFDKIGEQVLKFPLGSLTGAPLLTGIGPDVSIRIMPAGNVVCRFKSVFKSAGINQTIHKIFIEVCAETNVVLPVSSYENIESVVEIYIAETVLVGDIPDTYVNFGSGIIDFLPK